VQERFPGWQPGDPPPVGSHLYAHEAFVRDNEVVVGKACGMEVMAVLGPAQGSYPGWLLRLRNLDEDGEPVEVPCLAAAFGDLAWMRAAHERGAVEHGMAVLGFAYALTVHKSQGSEFGSVLLVDDYARKSAPDYRRWLYTGVTRAKNMLVYARG
jgi:UvrD-like helicase C-terminal domain